MVTEVLINGKIYKLESDDTAALRETAAALDERLRELEHAAGFGRLDKEQKVLFAELSLTDELLRLQKEKEELLKKQDEAEKELYALKHDVVELRMKLEEAKARETAMGFPPAER